MNDNQEDIFNIKLNAQGIDWIFRFCKTVKIVLLLGIFQAGISTIFNIIHIRNSELDLFKGKSLLRVEHLYGPYYWILYSFFFILQLYFYWKFSVALKKSIVSLDEYGFNQSFGSISKNAKVAIILFVMSLAASIFNLIILIKYPV